MADFTPSRLGQSNLTGDALALFLKVFPGEVMATFDTLNVMMDKHVVRSIASGKSAQFPATGKANSTYMTPGNELSGTEKIAHAERIISIDSLLVADTFVADIDEAMNHYEIRGEYAHQLAEALAKKADQQLQQVLVLAARASTTVTGGFGGSAVTNASAKTDGEILASLCFDATQAFDEKDVPDSDRFVGMRPAQFYLAVQTTKLLNRDWGGQGSFATADLPTVADLQVVKTNNLPITNISAETGVNNTYDGDFSKTAAVAWQKSAIGTVKLLDLRVENQYMITRKGTILTADYAWGHGILRPESAVEIATP